LLLSPSYNDAANIVDKLARLVIESLLTRGGVGVGGPKGGGRFILFMR